MDSFIGWVGGKKLLRKTIAEKFPPDISKYVEVFGGAGWVLFYRDSYAKHEVFNDINGELVNLFRCVKYHPEALIKDMQFMLNSREIFGILKNQSIEGLTDIQRAARYLYLIKASYGSKVKDYGGKPRDLLRFNNFEDIQKRLAKVVIENKCYEDIIKHYDSESTLFYLDPPYYQAESLYDTGSFKFDEEQHINLNKVLAGVKGRFVLSYNNCEFIKNIYAGFNIEEVERQNNLNSRYGQNKMYKELIISNY